MIEVTKRGRCLTYVDVYFAETAEYHVKQKCDICTYQNTYSLHDKKNMHSVGYTLISDLTQNEEQLWGAIRKGTRYEIRRAERYPIDFTAFDSSQILGGAEFQLDHFQSMYESMFANKGLPRKLDKDELLAIVACGGGLITAALVDSAPVVYHFYITDDRHAKLTISCSDLWGGNQQQDKNLIGYSNKWLHWKDYLYLKKLGVASYDWGGVTWNEEDQGILTGINKFKQSFGGEPVSYYSETVVMTNKAKLLRALSRMKRQPR